MILIPRISSTNTMENKNNTKEQINYYLKFTISCIFMFIPIFIALSLPICNFVFNNTSAGLYLKYTCWTMIPLGLNQITTSILNALNQENKTFIYYIISSLIMLSLVFILPKYLGVSAMIHSIGISSIIQLMLNIIKLYKLTNIKTHIMSLIISHTLISIPIVLIIEYSYKIFNILCSQFLTIALTCIISVLSYIALLFVFNILEFNKTKELIIKVSRKKNTSEL